MAVFIENHANGTGSDDDGLRDIMRGMENDLLKCPVCQEDFNQPKILPCLHSFCFDCLENSLKQSNIGAGQAFLCPICRHQCFVPMKGVNALRDNIFFVTLQEFHDRKTLNPEQLCEACESGAVAKRQCMECNDWLCSKCCAMHAKVKVTKDHHLLTVDDLKGKSYDERIKDSFEPLICSVHGEALKLFCVNPACMAPICTVCKTTQSHGSHPAIELEAQAIREAQNIKGLMPNMRKAITDTSVKINNLKHEEKVVSHVRKKVHKMINDRVQAVLEKVVQQINQYAEGLHQDVEKIIKDHKKDVVRELDDSQFKLKGMMTARTFTESLLDFNRAEELVTLSRDVRQRLLEFQKPIDTMPPGWRQPRLQPADDIETKTIAKLFGELTYEGELIRTQLLSSFTAEAVGDERKLALCDITLDEGDNLLIVDRDNHRIKVFNSRGNLLYIVAEDTLRAPNRVHFLRKTDRLLVKDDKYLKLLNRDGTFVANFAPTLKQPVGLAQNLEGEVLVTDWMSGNIHVFDELGTLLRQFHCACEAPGYITTAADGTVIVSDWKQHTVKIFDPQGGLRYQYGNYGSGPGQLDHPYGVCTDRYDHVLIADTWNNRIHMVSKEGRFERFLLTKDDGLNYPQALAVTRKGYLIIVEQQGAVKVYQYMA